MSISTGDKKYTTEDVMQEILSYIKEDEEHQYKVIVGSDSLYRKKKTCFSTVVIAHRVGKGARFWYSREYIANYPQGIVKRIMKETYESITLMQAVQDSEIVLYVDASDFCVHIDAGADGASIKVMHQALSFVKGMGFNAEAKPKSSIAANVADKFTK